MSQENDIDVDKSSDQNGNKSFFMCGVVEGFYGKPWSLDQRRDLFAKLRRFGMNTYLYAPKDDVKHRAHWRESYTVEESEQLTLLINAAKQNNILFIYAISPGLDIGYSNPKDISALKRKLDQVKQFGCPAFAILFDDIEPELNESDKEVFKSFASAQISVTNEVYDHVAQEHFLFCPTEYCASRAVPSVQHSEYLSTIGSKLNANIDIMWTGSKVISANISLAQIQELSEILKRHPIIWDNLHANDYDQKRLFLGPYSGRSTKLLPLLKGVLTNPNCEYETNFIPIHTLGLWSKCTEDACEQEDVKLESDDDSSLQPAWLNSTYHPRHALTLSINEWISEFNIPKAANIQANLTCLNQVTTSGPPDVVSPLAAKVSDKLSLDADVPIADLTNPQSESSKSQSLEPMECNPSPENSPKDNFLDVPMKEKDDAATKSLSSLDSEEMQTEPESESVSVSEETKTNSITNDDVALLVDLFYLPFEHGSQGVQILQDFHWLKSNGFIVSEYRKNRNETNLSSQINEWYEKAAKFNDTTLAIGRLLTRLTFCKNRSLLYDLYPYVWDIKGVIGLLNSYVKWIALGRVPMTNSFQPLGLFPATFSWFSKGYREAFSCGDQEPWLFRGGLTGELQRLLPVESVSDLFLYKAPDSPSSRIYTIRPYLPNDQLHIYEVCFNNFDRHVLMDNQQDVVGDKLVGGMLTLSPEYCFIVEDEIGLCGYVLAVLDSKTYYNKMEVSWIPEMLKKYPLKNGHEENGSIESGHVIKFIEEMHSEYKQIMHDPEVVYKSYPSMMVFSMMATVIDLSVPKRMLACVIAALKANGSKGVCSRVIKKDKQLLDFYIKLGFQVINLDGAGESDFTYVGRAI